MLLVALACPQVEGVLVSILLRAGIRSTPGLDCCASACYSPWRGCLQLVFQAARGLLSGESDPLPLKFAGVHPVMVCLAVTAGGSTLDEVRTTVQPSATSAERSAFTVFDRSLVQCQKHIIVFNYLWQLLPPVREPIYTRAEGQRVLVPSDQALSSAFSRASIMVFIRSSSRPENCGPGQSNFVRCSSQNFLA